MMPLAMVKEGAEVTIHCVNCGQGLKRRLCDLGLYNGTKVSVLKNDISGPIIIKVKDSKIVLGRGQTHKIMVEKIEG
ncbi:MAG: ferrous iron transport protein A [Candidatus Omnitrophica bacterium]|nr:ferrous iron transport protein A [Candidatus Omnitrophota bacterium]